MHHYMIIMGFHSPHFPFLNEDTQLLAVFRSKIICKNLYFSLSNKTYETIGLTNPLTRTTCSHKCGHMLHSLKSPRIAIVYLLPKIVLRMFPHNFFSQWITSKVFWMNNSYENFPTKVHKQPFMVFLDL